MSHQKNNNAKILSTTLIIMILIGLAIIVIAYLIERLAEVMY